MLNHGVNVVCAQHNGQVAGLAVAWATQLSTDRILICVGNQSTTRELILNAKAFGLSVLYRDQVEIARLFGRTSSRSVNKFENIGYHTGETGSPLLDDCMITLDCRVEAVHDDNGHKLIIGSVVRAESLKREAEPLIYREEDY
jgi:flavin reductase (DIM6/NTAB) family NADH-FMN oxidoreductase RutF